MDWTQIEYICDRLAIIDKGEIVAIGSVEEIRRELTSGYTATLKLKVDEAYSVFTGSLERTCSMGSNVMLPNDKVVLLKREFLESFETSILMDEHIRMLYFHIGDPNRELLYSEMFRKLENLRQKHDVVEDYTLSETTVDEVLSTIDHILHGSGSKHEISKKILSLDTKPNCTSTLTSNQTKQD
ncbi:linearmycin resistance ATP-binding protein LnrL-like [Pectinophora gossypiella]|uniref:linearmycin resistance ATP-binding protein LnrL-like n=1 Tax=Pectinophora gossypiella TaxID=13191 RepID=UPI00214F5219|nr:linearmycin resistance ATP-binding protein LnrL-like [Pectinophora gossypiella]